MVLMMLLPVMVGYLIERRQTIDFFLTTGSGSLSSPEGTATTCMGYMNLTAGPGSSSSHDNITIIQGTAPE